MSRTEDFEIKRNEILDCAEQLFMMRGYELTTVNAILKKVGIAKGTFYYYFTSKEEVMDAVIMRIVWKESDYAKQILTNEEMTPIEKLVASLFRKPKSNAKKTIVERLSQANNALMKQRALQRTLEIVCPIYAEIVNEGNIKKEFSSSNPLCDIQFLIAGIQTLYDLSSVDNSSIEVGHDAVLNAMFQVLKMDETKISKEQVKGMIVQNM